MKSASSAASGSGQQRVKRSAADAEPEALTGVPMEICVDESAAWPSALAANTKRRIAEKSAPVAITTQEGIDGYREQAMRIASVSASQGCIQFIIFGSTERIKAFNRRLHWGKKGIVSQHDPRHVDVHVKDRGREQGTSVPTPAMHDVTEEEREPLDQVQHSRYRWQFARSLCLGQDRADRTFIVNE